MAKKKELIRVELYAGYDVLVYEDQAEQLTQAKANELFSEYGVKEIHELHPVWGGRWVLELKKKK